MKHTAAIRTDATRRDVLAHLNACHTGWRAETTTAEHNPFEGPLTRAEVLAAHREEHLAGGNDHEEETR